MRVRLHLNSAANSLLLPRDAVVRAPDGSESVWVVAQHDGVDKVTKVPVKTGRAQRDFVEVAAEALSVGDRVVVRGNEILRAEQAVTVTETLRPAF